MPDFRDALPWYKKPVGLSELIKKNETFLQNFSYTTTKACCRR